MKRRKKSTLVSNIIFSIITLFSLTLVVIFLFNCYKYRSELELSQAKNKEYEDKLKTFIYTQEDIDSTYDKAIQEANETERQKLLSDMRDRLSSGDSAYSLFRDIFPNDLIVVVDSEYVFYPITDDYKHNEYVSEQFVKDETTGEITYTDENGNVISQKGIDVSKHNGDIDWAKVKESGIEFAIIRVGYRGSSEGKIVLDEKFTDNIKGAIKNDIKVGVYFFTQAINEEEAIEEADFVLDAIEPYNISMPVVWDVEEQNGRTDEIDAKTRTDACLAFLNRVEGAGYDSMIYGNLKSMLYMLETDRIEDSDKWFAYYHYPDYYPYEYRIWQYSANGKVDGVSGDVDLNIMMK